MILNINRAIVLLIKDHSRRIVVHEFSWLLLVICHVRGPWLLESLEIGLVIIVTEHVLTLVVGFILSLGVQTSEYIVDAETVIPSVLIIHYLHFG